MRWLKHKGDGLYLFAKALDGDKDALAALESRQPEKLADLFDTIAHCDVEQWLDENHPDLHRLFAFVRGEEAALRGLKHRKVTYQRVGEALREHFRNYHDEDGETESASSADGEPALPEGAAADVGCLIGEMHLQNEEFHKAVDAFSRAVETNPTADAYEGRAALSVLWRPWMPVPPNCCAIDPSVDHPRRRGRSGVLSQERGRNVPRTRIMPPRKRGFRLHLTQNLLNLELNCCTLSGL